MKPGDETIRRHAAELFSRSNNANKENGQPTDGLHRGIGQLTAERKMIIELNSKLSRVR